MKNLKTPRNLADCYFPVGWEHGRPTTVDERIEKALGVLLAVAIGIFLGIGLFYWFAA